MRTDAVDSHAHCTHIYINVDALQSLLLHKLKNCIILCIIICLRRPVSFTGFGAHYSANYCRCNICNVLCVFMIRRKTRGKTQMSDNGFFSLLRSEIRKLNSSYV